MRTQKHLVSLCNILVGFLLLMGCAAPISNLTPPPSVTLSPTVHPSPTLTPVPSRSPRPFPSTPTLMPTLPFSQEQKVNEVLQAENCTLPCYLGITPVITTLSEARAILESLGGSYMGEYIRQTDGASSYTYLLNFGGRPERYETPRPDGSIMTVSHYVSLITNNEIVQIMQVGVGTIGPGTSTAQAREKIREYWRRYTARGIFLQIGLPDQLYTDPPTPNIYGSDLLAIYKKLGVVADIYGTGKENNICPEREARFIFVRLSLFNPASSLSIYSDGRVQPTDRDVWLPINEVLGVDVQEFYRSVVSDPLACFKRKVINP